WDRSLAKSRYKLVGNCLIEQSRNSLDPLNC
ncbi:MAG: hypothetical protein ACI957_005746, partial [Verrucomicrobiales bacterium]